MKSILEAHNEKGNFHHGYLLVGDFEISRQMALKAAKTILFQAEFLEIFMDSVWKAEIHPDFFYQKFDLFGIDDSQALRQKASQRPFAGDSKVFIIEITFFSVESANAILKLFEEPYKGVYFFVIVSSVDNVIPTLCSRLTIINNTNMQKVLNDLNEEKIKFYKKFLKDLPKKRLESIKNFIKEKEKAIIFLNELEIIITENLKNFEVLEQIQKCRDFLFQKGSSPKMILEHLALVLP